MILQPQQPTLLAAIKSCATTTNILFVLRSAVITWLLCAPAVKACSSQAGGQYTDLAKMLRSSGLPTIVNSDGLCLRVEQGGSGDAGYSA